MLLETRRTKYVFLIFVGNFQLKTTISYVCKNEFEFANLIIGVLAMR